MSIIDTLVTDRTQADVTAVKALNAVDMSKWSVSDVAKYLAGMKGSYNASDLNRVSLACEYLHGIMVNMGYIVPNYTTPKTDWEFNDVPTAAQMRAYLGNIASMKETWSAIQAIPDTMNGLGYEDANNIEKLLIELDDIAQRIQAIFIRSGAWNAYSGTVFYIKN